MGYEFGSLLPEVIVILEALLAQAEQLERKQVVRVRLNKRDHYWYFSMKRLVCTGRLMSSSNGCGKELAATALAEA